MRARKSRSILSFLIACENSVIIKKISNFTTIMENLLISGIIRKIINIDKVVVEDTISATMFPWKPVQMSWKGFSSGKIGFHND